MRCLDGLVNNFNEMIIRAIRCNMDIKFIGSGPSTKAVIYYITDYITKSQLKTHVAFAALELAVKKLNDNENEDDLATTRAKRLLQKCAYAMVSHQELSAQQVCSYLMDFEDHFTSHEYRNIFWKSFEIYVDRVLPLIAPDDSEPHTEETNGDCTDHFENDDRGEAEEGDEVGVTTNIAGEIVPKNGQVLDYMQRGDALRQISLWEYVAGIHKLTKKRVSNGNENGTYLNNVADSEVQAAWNSTSFARAKYPFSESHPDMTLTFNKSTGLPKDSYLFPSAPLYLVVTKRTTWHVTIALC